MKIIRGCALILILGGLSLAVPTMAHAAPCSATSPGQVAPAETRNVHDSRIRLESGRRTSSQPIFEFKVSGCEVEAGETPVRVLGLSDNSGVTGRLVAKSSQDVSLILDFGTVQLEPATYEISAVSQTPGVAILQGAAVDVRDGSPAAPLLVTLTASLISLLVLALRAAAAADKGWKSVPSYFKPAVIAVPFIASLVGAGAVLKAQWVDNQTYFGTIGQVGLLFGSLVSAMIAGGTVATAVTKAGASTAPTT